MTNKEIELLVEQLLLDYPVFKVSKVSIEHDKIVITLKRQ